MTVGIARLFTQTATVQTYTGTGTTGPKYAAEVTVPCFVNDRRQLVRSGSGDEVVSETTLYAPLASLPTFTPQSKVTVNGRIAQVISAYRRDSAGPVNVHHTQVVLL